MKTEQKADTIKVKTFSRYKLIDLNDMYQKVHEYLIEKGLTFCFLEDRQIITRNDCRMRQKKPNTPRIKPNQNQ